MAKNVKKTSVCLFYPSLRYIVSENKRRFQRDGFDLDLVYITKHVIAMSFPSTGISGLYRNPLSEVARFFNHKHPGHYRIYNLCSERAYSDRPFKGAVVQVTRNFTNENV